MPSNDLYSLADQIAAKYKIPKPLFRALIQQESGWNPRAKSPAGAMGLAQLMPGTARGLGVSDPYNPQQSLTGGARYLADQYKKFGRWDLALSAYNSGPGGVESQGRIEGFPETQNYVKKIMAQFKQAGQEPVVPGVSGTRPAAPAARQVTPRQRLADPVLASIFESNNRLIGVETPPGLLDAIAQAPPQPPPKGSAAPPRGRKGAPPAGKTPLANRVLEIAHQQIGKPYVWGAESPGEGGFDCSGLIDYAMRQAGVKLPPGRLTTYSMMKLGRSVRGQKYQPGDWIITNKGNHVVMYVGGNKVIAAPRRGEAVQYQNLSRFKGQIVDVRRVM